MRILELEVQRFRGIQYLQWRVGGTFACLVGPCDSCKTTLLDAIDLVFSPRYSISFDDTDFFSPRTPGEDQFEITATVGGVPEQLLSDSKFGWEVRGWSENDGLHDEPLEGDEKALSIRLRVGKELEPQWTVINNRNKDGRLISAHDREVLGVSRLGSSVERHLGWNRGSVLSKFGAADKDLSLALADAGRAARDSLDADELADLKAICKRAQEISGELGVVPRNQFSPGLDVATVTANGSLILCDGSVPMRRAGLGTKRLVALALQRNIAAAGGVTLVDEIEHGLEPHRIERLLKALRPTDNAGQVFLTTHSPVVIIALRAEDICLVRNVGGIVEVKRLSPGMQHVVRSSSLALLARRILVCEGRTEWGLSQALDAYWIANGLHSFAYGSIEPIDGGGDTAPKRAKALAEMGYDVALLADSDVPSDPDDEALAAAGVSVLRWAGGVCTEERIALDLPWKGIQEIVNEAESIWGVSIHDSVKSKAGPRYAQLSSCVNDWIDSVELRRAIGKAADDKGWFKTVEFGKAAGEIVCRYLDAIGTSDLSVKIGLLRNWIEKP